MGRILVIQLGRLGDVIQTTPLVDDLIHDPTGHEVDLLICDEFRSAIQGLRGLGTIRSLPIASFDLLEKPITDGFKAGNIPRAASDLVRALALPCFDRVINCSTTALGCWIAGQVSCASREGGVVTRSNECLFFGDHHVYVVARQFFREQNWFNLVDLWRVSAPSRRTLGSGSRPYVELAQDLPFALSLPPGRKVCINPGSSASHRRWPAEQFARVAEELSARGLAPILVGAPSDQALCEQVATACRINLLNFCGRTSIPQMARLLSEVDLLVSADTGAVHIAAAVGTKVLGLYGATAYFAQTAPWGEGHLVLQAPPGDALCDLSPDLVLAAALNRAGLASESDLRNALACSGTEAWETVFLPPPADPLGGVAYRPLHAAPCGMNCLFTRALRHAFARAFCGRQGEISMDYLRAWIAPPHVTGDSGSQSLQGETRAAIAPVIGVLDQMAAAAVRCRDLCEGPRRSPGELTKLTEALARALDELKASTANNAMKPVIHYLDWKIRMIPRVASPETFRRYEAEYRSAMGLLEGAASLVADLLGAEHDALVARPTSAL